MLFLRLTTLKIKLSVFERTTLHPDSMQRYPEVLFSREHRDILINKYIPRLTDLFELLPSQKQATKSQIKKADNPLIPTCRPVRTIESTARVVEFHKGCDSLSPPRTVSSLPKGLKGQGTASREFLRSRTRSRLCVCTHVPADNNTRGVGRNPRDRSSASPDKGARGVAHTRARASRSKQRSFQAEDFQAEEFFTPVVPLPHPSVLLPRSERILSSYRGIILCFAHYPSGRDWGSFKGYPWTGQTPLFPHSTA